MRNIIITGTSRGIGYQLVKLLAEKDNIRIFSISRKANEIKFININNHSHIIPIQFDLLQLKTEPQRLVDLILPYTDRVDILINNAGILINRAYDYFESKEITHIFDINYLAPSILIQSLIPMLQKAKGHVVNIASMGGFQGSVKFKGLSHYSASKAALSVLTECLASEYADSGIRFNALALGAVQTEMLAEAFPGYQAPLSALQAAEFIVQFALDGHQYFNGKILPVSLSTP